MARVKEKEIERESVEKIHKVSQRGSVSRRKWQGDVEGEKKGW